MLKRIEQESFLLDPEKYLKMMKAIVEKYNKTECKDTQCKSDIFIYQNPHKLTPKGEILYFHLLRYFQD